MDAVRTLPVRVAANGYAVDDTNSDTTGYYPIISLTDPTFESARDQRMTWARIRHRGAGSACVPAGNSSTAPIWSNARW